MSAFDLENKTNMTAISALSDITRVTPNHLPLDINSLKDCRRVTKLNLEIMLKRTGIVAS